MKKSILILVLTLPFLMLLTPMAYAQEVTIGTQVWMTKNLNVDKFRNGDPIPEAKTIEEWKKAKENKQPAWCYYDTDPANGAKYGKLYNWYAVNDARGLAPKGWHIPTDAEWTLLTDHLGGSEVAGGKMKSTSGWNNNGNGTNSSGFSGLPGGYGIYDGTFYHIGKYGRWWSSTELNTRDAWDRYLSYFNGSVNRRNDNLGGGMSVRCVSDQNYQDDAKTKRDFAVSTAEAQSEGGAAKSTEVFTIVEEQPAFPGGVSELNKFIQKNLKYPQAAIDAGIKGKCFLKFIVNETGKISNVEVLKGIRQDCDKEAIRVIESMPLWQPAKMSGRPVKCYFIFSVPFKLP